MALKAITQVASPSFQRGKLKKLEEQRPSVKMNAKWITSADADFSHSVAVEAREKAAKARAAGGLGQTKTLHDTAQAMLFSTETGSAPSLPFHLRSAFKGAGVVPSPERDGGVPRSPRCNSPRYLQATMASALRSRVAADDRVDTALMEPAGGDSNNATKHTMDLANEPGEAPRRLRRSLSAPRSRAKDVIFAPSSDPASSGAGADAAAQLHITDGAQTARPTSPGFASHDKSIPNSRRSQRAAGHFVPGPVLTSVEALASSKGTLITDAGFASDAIKHRGRGLASPMKLRPTADPNPVSETGLATQQISIDGAGVASGLAVRDTLLLGRRGKGVCSPAPARGGRSPYQWDNA